MPKLSNLKTAALFEKRETEIPKYYLFKAVLSIGKSLSSA